MSYINTEIYKEIIRKIYIHDVTIQSTYIQKKELNLSDSKF